MDSAYIFIKAYNLQVGVDKDTVLNNIEKYYGSADELTEHHSNVRQSIVVNTCGCTVNTYHAWFNRSRKNVKIPLIPLCKLAVSAGVDIFDLFRA